MKKIHSSEIIVEIGQSHDGSLGMLHSYIDLVSKTGADVVKFQTHIASAESSKFEKFRIHFSKQDKTRYDYWRRMEFSKEQWREIKSHCDENNIEFMSSPFSIEAVELLEDIGMERYKIASGEVNNFLMLDVIASTGKPVILSSGMSSFKELDLAVSFLNKRNVPLSIMQCTTSYPVQPENLGLNILEEMKHRYNLPVGLSDHSGTIYPSLAAAALGASIIEIHLAFHQDMFGPDTKSSILPHELKQLVEGIKFINTALNNPVNKNESEKYDELKNLFGKSLSVRTSKRAGDTLFKSDLETKKPAGYGIHPSDYQNVIGRKLARDLQQGEFLNETDLL